MDVGAGGGRDRNHHATDGGKLSFGNRRFPVAFPHRVSENMVSGCVPMVARVLDLRGRG